MQTYSDYFEKILREWIDESIKRLEEHLSNGYVNNFEEYKFLVGQVNGLRSTLEMCDEARKAANNTMR